MPVIQYCYFCKGMLPLDKFNQIKGIPIMEKSKVIHLRNNQAECKISLWGGNLLSYRPLTEEHDIFWLGDLNKFDNIQAIRGGIPVCWPRFAEEQRCHTLPRHGFARLSIWDLQKAYVDENKIELELSLTPDAKYNLNLSARVYIKITDRLEYALETTNHGDEEFIFSEALHAYFNVSSVENVIIKGLSGHRYKNSLDGNFYTLDKDLQIKGEFDSIFQNQVAPITIVDKGFARKIVLEKQGSQTMVVWNPAKDLAEMSPNQYKTFICVEPSNVGEYGVKLAPHKKHILSTTISLQR